MAEIGGQNELKHHGQGKQELLDAYQMSLQTLQKLRFHSVAERAERMQRVIATPELAEVIRPDASKAVFVHSTDSETAEKILRTGLFASSLSGIHGTVTPLEPIGEGMSPEVRRTVLSDNLINLTSVGSLDGSGISGEAKIIIELPPPPKFGPEGDPLETIYGSSDWTSQYVKQLAVIQSSRGYSIVHDSILPLNYIMGCIDFKEPNFIKNSRFNLNTSVPKRGGIWKKFFTKK